jgi:hypothetical protein
MFLVATNQAPFAYAEKNKLKHCSSLFVWEKNTVPAKKNKPKSTDYKPTEHGLYKIVQIHKAWGMVHLSSTPTFLRKID